MTTAEGVMGFQGIAINVWLIWMLPFIGAALIPALRRNKPNLLNYTAVGFSLASAILASHINTTCTNGFGSSQSNKLD